MYQQYGIDTNTALHYYQQQQQQEAATAAAANKDKDNKPDEGSYLHFLSLSFWYTTTTLILPLICYSNMIKWFLFKAKKSKHTHIHNT